MSYNDDLHSLSHTKWNCKYHVVFAMVFSITHRCVNFTKEGFCSMSRYFLRKSPQVICPVTIWGITDKGSLWPPDSLQSKLMLYPQLSWCMNKISTLQETLSTFCYCFAKYYYFLSYHKQNTNSPDELQIFVCLIGAVSFYAVTKIQPYISVCAFYRYCA